MSFIMKGSQILALQLKGWFKSKNIEMKYKTYIKLVHEIYNTCSGTMWRIKNQPSNSSSCSDNALCLLVLVLGSLYWELKVTSAFSIWGCVLKGCFEGGVFWRANSCLKGIEDFNLEHSPWARSHLHSAGPRPFHASFTTSSPTHTCVGTLSRWEPMWQYLVKITNIKVDINFIIPK